MRQTIRLMLEDGKVKAFAVSPAFEEAELESAEHEERLEARGTNYVPTPVETGGRHVNIPCDRFGLGEAEDEDEESEPLLPIEAQPTAVCIEFGGCTVTVWQFAADETKGPPAVSMSGHTESWDGQSK